jgi:translation initiation factor 4G
MVPFIRPARADDAAFLAWVMLAASRSHLPRGLWDLMLDAPDGECLAFLEKLALAEPGTFCHWSGFVVAEVDGHPAAALSGYDPGAVAEPEPVIGMTYLGSGHTTAELETATERFSPFFTCVPDQTPGTWIVEWVATRPEFRRRGLVESLLGTVLSTGRTRGYSRAQISILVGNTPAQRAYEKQGFRLVHDRRHPDFEAAIGCPGIAQYGMEL